MGGRKSKITTNSLFYSDEDYNFETEIGMDYISQDTNQSVLVFQVDRAKSSIIDIYDEYVDEKSISYKEPVKINVIFNIENATNKSYDKTQNLARYLQVGNLTFHVYEKTLKENNIDISYGDYIGVQVTADQMEYFVVSNDGRVNFDNKHMMYGKKAFYRSISCVSVDKNEFSGI